MVSSEIEARLLAALERCKRLLPAEELAEMSDLVNAGEPGVALEDLCVQLYEYSAPITHDLHRELQVSPKLGVE
jgi:hypothetical protein